MVYTIHNKRKYALYGWRPSHITKNEPTLQYGEEKLLETDTPVVEDPSTLPGKVDLREYFPPPYDQGHIGSCTANAAAAALEYYQRLYNRRQKGVLSSKTPSRLFIYKHNRLLGGTRYGDTGSTIKDTMHALYRFGAPEEDERFRTEYDPADFERDYPNFVYAMADDYSIDAWYNYDDLSNSPDKILDDMKRHLTSGLPIVFGFTVFHNSITNAAKDGMIKYPEPSDTIAGGHAVLAVGYDDRKQALIIRNSWGVDWGDRGYGYLDYKYILNQLAADFWSIIHSRMLSVIDFSEDI